MYVFKRQLSRQMSWEDNQPIKKLCIQNSISSFEDLSNELLYDVLDYFDLSEIFYSFHQLNQRIQNVIFNSRLPLKCQRVETFDQLFDKFCRQMIIPNRHRILSLRLSNHFQCMKFFNIHPIDPSFEHLQSLTLHETTYNDILSLLPTLISLSKLTSLTISLPYLDIDPNEIYQRILQLPVLKYNKLSISRSILEDMNFNFSQQQISSIEYLIINHLCTAHHLNEILLCTPKLRHLTCTNLYQVHRNSSINLLHLKSLSIPVCYLPFEEFKVLIQNVGYHVETLRFQFSSDLMYFDAKRWNTLIQQSMPNLRQFYLKYSDKITDMFQYKTYHSNLHRFISLFWIYKGWSYHIDMDFKHCLSITINYSIEWSRSRETISELTIHNCHFDNLNPCLTNYFECLTSSAKITHLNIEFQQFSLNILLELIQWLTQLKSICVQLPILNSIYSLTQQQIQTIQSIAQTNRIIKLQTKHFIDLNLLEIFLHLCSQIQTLDIECQDENQLQTFLRLILTKKSLSLTSLCFRLSQADENIVEHLRISLSQEHCTIQRIQNQIFIRWL